MMLDTNIVIAYLSGEPALVNRLSRWKEDGVQLLLSIVAETEVLSFPGWSEEECRAMQVFLAENFTSVPFERGISSITSRIRRETRLKFPDAAIAASALYTHAPLVTRNVRDFKRIAALDIVTL